MVANSTYAEKMQYRSNHVCNPTKSTDILNGTHYTSLLGKCVTIGDEELPMWFPPEERFHKKNIISLGSIPKKPLDLDSFLWPVIQELLQLEIGVSAFDALLQSIFTLHAYLIVVFGDIPAVLLIMCMKGHNTIVPC